MHQLNPLDYLLQTAFQRLGEDHSIRWKEDDRIYFTITRELSRGWHCNDAKAPRGSKLDRHQHVGKGTIGKEMFRRLLNDLRLTQQAFIAETPIDQPGDDRKNVEALKKLVAL